VSFTDTTSNQGAAGAPASTTGYYFSTNTTVDAADVLLATRAVATLAAGAGHTGSVTFTIPAGVGAGAYWILARADVGSVAGDAQVANNVRARQVLIGPDLVVTSFAAPTIAAAGLTLTVSDSTRNQGSVAAEPSTTRFYLSSDVVLDGTDVLLGSRPVPALAPGETHSASSTLVLPADTPTGSYYLFAKADGAGVLFESQEANNTSTRVLRIGPDLVVAGVTLPSSVGANGTMTVSAVTRNQGAAAVGPSTTAFYLSADVVLGSSDILLGTLAVPRSPPEAATPARRPSPSPPRPPREPTTSSRAPTPPTRSSRPWRRTTPRC
jgi:subtilase family serine protease